MNPIIGITSGREWELKERYYVNGAYIKAITKASGIPIIIPHMAQKKLESILDIIQGLLIPGGIDIDANLFNQEPHPKSGTIDPLWDQHDMGMIRGALARNLPILAICRGCQILNVACGGTLIQDINAQTECPIKHEQEAPNWYATHGIKLEPDSLLAGIFATNSLRINSYHHQAVAEVAPGFRFSAIAADGIIEAIESIKHEFVIGVQWHPELMVDYYPVFQKLFQRFVMVSSK